QDHPALRGDAADPAHDRGAPAPQASRRVAGHEIAARDAKRVKIVVCVKQAPATTAEKRYPADLRLDRAAAESVINPLDEYAIEQALRLQEAGAVETGASLSLGPEWGGSG